MRYPNNAQYRVPDWSPDGAGFQKRRKGFRPASQPSPFKRRGRAGKIGVNKLPDLFGAPKPVVKTFGKRVFRGVGFVVGGSPWGRVFKAVDLIAPMLQGEPSYKIIPPPGGGLTAGGDPGVWVKTAGPFEYPENFPAYQFAGELRISRQVYHQKITGQSIAGSEDWSQHLNTTSRNHSTGFWVPNYPGSPSVKRWAHVESWALTPYADRFDKYQPIGEPFTMKVLPGNKINPTARGNQNPWLSPTTKPGFAYPDPFAEFAVPTSANHPFAGHLTFTTSRGPRSEPKRKKPKKRKKQKKRTKEKKLIAGVLSRSAIGRIIGATGEGIEFVDILANSVDFGYRITDGTVGDSHVPNHVWNLQKRKWNEQRRNGERLTKLTPQEKAKFVWDYWDYIDWDRAGEAFVLNQLEDQFFGAIGKENAKASRRRGSPVGYQFGWAL